MLLTGPGGSAGRSAAPDGAGPDPGATSAVRGSAAAGPVRPHSEHPPVPARPPAAPTSPRPSPRRRPAPASPTCPARPRRAHTAPEAPRPRSAAARTRRKRRHEPRGGHRETRPEVTCDVAARAGPVLPGGAWRGDMGAAAAEQQQQLRSLRDFLLVYNRMTEICFRRCVSDLGYRLLSRSEERCLDCCAGKLIRSNHRLMGAYVALMPGIVQRRAASLEDSAERAAPDGPEAPVTPSAADTSPAAPPGT
ncbi:mitochondrial import inner membrane translocase subunit Tim10 B [Excalfactoria chinensis]|uniref:mitochondrial import inner membrane translocase subunit Tim10 B n=1 Tax=Excalfactoria chinensis TaxID=46218 RepID=UPI003B3B092D